ncbi:MAG: response regulator transcription factor [Erysipelotrichaceae bacterium]|nr:response regulator transcription factor [Erysipelotrichaceae bacterium]
MYKILIVEDDKTIYSLLKEHLEKWGYIVKGIDDFNNIIDVFNEFKPNIVLLDIYLPFYNGYYWCQNIRKISNVPIMFISSASENMNIIMAMDIGADDFIVKPFDIDVLISKVKALIRRTYQTKKEQNLLEYNNVSLNINDASLFYEGKRIELTKNDFRILVILFENVGKIVSRDLIMQKLWETDEFIDDNTLTVNMTRLKKKLEEFGINNFIKTKKGVGYYI